MAKVHDTALNFRSMSLRADSLDEQDRSIGAIAATEQPVPMFDWQRMEVVPEVLRVDGAIIPESRQVPLLDSHQRHTNDNLLGSFKGASVVGDQLHGRSTFSSAKSAEDSYTKVREGHLKDLSVGYRVLEKTFVPKGKTKDIGGRSYTGPVNVVTRWKLHEVSVTPIGADDQAKMRGYQSFPLANSKEGFVMNEELRAACIEAGMPADFKDEQAQTWLTENVRKLKAAPDPKKNEDSSRGNGLSQEDVAKLIAKAIEDQDNARKAARDEFRSYVKAAAEKRNLSSLEIDDIIGRCHTKEEALEAIADKVANRSYVNPRFVAGPSEVDKHRAAIGHGLLSRAMRPEHFDKDVPNEKRAAGWQDYRYRSLSEIAAECAEMDGYDTRGLTKDVVAKIALGFGHTLPGVVRRSASYGYHNKGMFPQLMADAMNKNLLRGYTEVMPTWRRVFVQGPSVSDFKSIKKIRMSDVPNLEIWPGKKAPNEFALTDEQESYGIEAYSNAISVDYKAIVNDDLSGLSRVPFLLGSAAMRTVNYYAWLPITSNPTMNDGQPLFLASPTGNRKKSNYTSSGGAPSVAQLAKGRELLRLQVGANDPDGNASSAILNLEGRYLVVPAALETTALQLVGSQADPAASHAGVVNPARSLEVVVEPILDANSSASWYLFASPNQIDTVEVTFLQGQETPQTRTETCFDTLALKTIILQSFGAKALDHRGMYKNAG